MPQSQARIPVDDLAFLRGWGVFETMRTYGGRIFRLADHLSRLERSAFLTGLPIPWTRQELAGIVQETLDRNDFSETTLRILLTGGNAGDHFLPSGGSPGLLALPSRLEPYPVDCYTQGVKVGTSRVERYLPEAKTLFYLPGMLALRAAREADPEINEVLLLNRDGRVTEGVVSNLFLVMGEKLVTPGRDILPGITRLAVLELAEGRFEAEVRDVTTGELARADEIFLTGTVREIMPVSAVDGVVVGAGVCGPVTRRLQDAFGEMTQKGRMWDS